MNTNEVLKLALEALENWVEYFPQNVDDIDKKAITSMREELSKPDFWEGYVPEPVKPAQQEPVAFLVDDDLYYPEEIDWESLKEQGHTVFPLYTKDQL